MSRLTQWTPKGASLILDDPQNNIEAAEQVQVKAMEAWNKLAMFEDAEEQGRLVILPVTSAGVVPPRMKENIEMRHYIRSRLCKGCFVTVMNETQAACSMCSAVGCDFKTCSYTEQEIDNGTPPCDDFNCKGFKYCEKAFLIGLVESEEAEAALEEKQWQD